MIPHGQACDDADAFVMTSLRDSSGDPGDLPQRLAWALSGVLGGRRARRCTARAAVEWARKHTCAAKAEIAEQLYRTALGTAGGRPRTAMRPARLDAPSAPVAAAVSAQPRPAE
ncbi:hypothetical protein ACFV9D_15745 [Streptomyces sp. NPDC059875]|uniref:hypothetical protein n=1 Tax=unclassified Streptomyces TaxID=2593676 RepID=UPI00365E3882